MSDWEQIGTVREPMTLLGHHLEEPLTWVTPAPITMTLYMTHTRREIRLLRRLFLGRVSGPRPLAIDGHAYRRRTRRRHP